LIHLVGAFDGPTDILAVTAITDYNVETVLLAAARHRHVTPLPVKSCPPQIVGTVGANALASIVSTDGSVDRQ
jgi:hypothetical protein